MMIAMMVMVLLLLLLLSSQHMYIYIYPLRSHFGPGFSVPGLPLAVGGPRSSGPGRPASSRRPVASSMPKRSRAGADSGADPGAASSTYPSTDSGNDSGAYFGTGPGADPGDAGDVQLELIATDGDAAWREWLDAAFPRVVDLESRTAAAREEGRQRHAVKRLQSAAAVAESAAREAHWEVTCAVARSDRLAFEAERARRRAIDLTLKQQRLADEAERLRSRAVMAERQQQRRPP